MSLPSEEMLSFGLCGFALRRVGQLSLLACLGKAVDVSFEEVLSFGLVGNIVPLTYTLLRVNIVLPLIMSP